jgi:MoaA/NifB/PqqE/SkfB family radical SAM enzyme
MIENLYGKIIDYLRHDPIISKLKVFKYLKDNVSYLQDNYYKYKRMADSVAIENTADCNRKCPYCPHFWTDREKGLMPESLFKKIIDDLASFGYRGKIIFAPWSEPLLDKRLSSLVKYTKSKLPKSKITILTNGDFLTVKKTMELVDAGVEEVDVSDNYTVSENQYTIDEPKQAIQTYNQLDEKYKKSVHFHDLNYKKIRGLDRFHNRSALVPLKDCIAVESLFKMCELPEMILAINYKGEALLCVRQWRDTPVYGNVSFEHVKDIWRKEEFVQERAALRKGIFKWDVCKDCGVGYPLDPMELSSLKGSISKV